MGLLLKLFTSPVHGLVWLAEQLHEEARSQMWTEERILKELAQLNARYEAREIDQREFEDAEETLLDMLGEAKEPQQGASSEDSP